MLEALLQAAGAVAPFVPTPPVEDTQSLVHKITNGICWRDGCITKESSSIGLCTRHLQEAKSW
jgi:hypothetical protein